MIIILVYKGVSMINDDDMIILDLGDDNDESTSINKEDILIFFKNLKTMPTIDRQVVYQDILEDKVNLPKFKFEDYFLSFCAYKTTDNKEMIIIKDVGSDNYYYIYLEHVFKCNIYEAGNIFYGDIAKEKKQSHEDVHDMLIDKLGCYEAILLAPQNKYLSSLDDFIEDNIYMFEATLKEKQEKIKSKLKIK